jgi:hypothetical protein
VATTRTEARAGQLGRIAGCHRGGAQRLLGEGKGLDALPARVSAAERRGPETAAGPAGVVGEDQPTTLADVRRIVGHAGRL